MKCKYCGKEKKTAIRKGRYVLINRDGSIHSKEKCQRQQAWQKEHIRMLRDDALLDQGFKTAVNND